MLPSSSGFFSLKKLKRRWRTPNSLSNISDNVVPPVFGKCMCSRMLRKFPFVHRQDSALLVWKCGA